MVEVSKPDYLSLVNQNGSGFNISELVTSIVASEIEPKRSLQNTKLEKTESAISGIGFLNAQSTKTQSNFATISADNFYQIASSNVSAVEVIATDETKLDNARRIISDVEIAKSMVFEYSGFSDLSAKYSADLTFDFGGWLKTSAESTELTDTFQAGKTYFVNSEISNATDKFRISTYTDWSAGGNIPAGSVFTVNSGVSAVQLNTGEILNEVDTFDFTDADVAEDETISFSDETLEQIASRINGLEGLSAQVVDTLGDGSDYSLVISSANTGANNGFRILEDSSSHAGRWATPEIPSGNEYTNSFSQLAKNATFKLDGVAVSRSSNAISDLIDGAEINLNTDLAGSASVSIERSESAIRQTLTDTIFSLNEFKTEIDRLTFIDVEGDENGPLAMDTAATRIKSNFKKLSVEPLVGHGSDPIYLSQLGIKTNSSGEFYLDETTFEKTLNNNPDFFSVLKDINLSSDSQFATVTKSQYTTIPSGTYTVSNDSGQWKFGDTNLTQIDLDSGGSRFTSVTYPGLVIETVDRNPANFQVFSGNSFAQKIIDSMTDILALNSPLVSAEDTYKNLSVDIEERLEKLEEREKLITSRYTEQFGAMEQSMSQFNSTKTMLENFIEAWKKQK